MAMRMLNRITTVFTNFFVRIDDNLKEDAMMSQTLQGKVSLFAAMEAQKSRELAKDLIIHVSFFAIFIAILFMQRDVRSLYNINNGLYTAIIDEEIDSSLQHFPKTFLSLGKWDEYRDFVLGVFVPGINQMEDYSGRNISEDNLWNIQYASKVVGKVRFRTLRVKSESCKLSKQYKEVTSHCYSRFYNSDTRDTSPFGPEEDPERYTYIDDAGGVALFGHIKSFWDAGGYVVDVPLDDDFESNINQLVEDGFWGLPTRAMIITVMTVTPNYEDKATVFYLLAEFTAGGQVNTYAVVRTFRLSMYSFDASDNFRIFLEVVFCIFVIYYVVVLIAGLVVNVKIGRWRDFVFDLWNVIEFFNLALFLASIIMYLSYLTSRRTSLDLERSEYIVELEHLAENATQFYQISAISIINIVPRLKLSPRLYVIWETMYEARVDLATYLIMFLIILFGFLFFGWLTFGPDIYQFNGFANSLGTLWQFLIGNPPDYDQLALSNRVLGPIYYALFTVFVFFILVNMFVAIVSNSFDLVANRTKERQGVSEYNSGFLKKPVKRISKVAKAVLQRKPLYSETELLRMLRHREVLEKEVLTKQDIAEALKDIGEEPHPLYVERLQAIHEKRKKFLLELTQEEREKQKEALEEEYERRIENGEAVENLAIKMAEVDLYPNQDAKLDKRQIKEAEQIINEGTGRDRGGSILTSSPPPIVASSSTTSLLSVNSNLNNNNNIPPAFGAPVVVDTEMLRRMELMEAKLDSILLKLDLWKSKQE